MSHRRLECLSNSEAMASQKLYRPNPAIPEAYSHLQPILICPLHWEFIRQQSKAMTKYATALQLSTAEPEAILRRFTRKTPHHSTYHALADLGNAIKSIF